MSSQDPGGGKTQPFVKMANNSILETQKAVDTLATLDKISASFVPFPPSSRDDAIMTCDDDCVESSLSNEPDKTEKKSSLRNYQVRTLLIPRMTI